MFNYLKSLIRAEQINIFYSKKKVKFENNNLIPLKKYNFGKKNKNKKFYVISMKKLPRSGLFSNVSFVLDHIEYAQKKKLVPVIDMENFPTVYNENKKINNTYNSWEYYFEKITKYSLDEVYKSKNVYFSTNERLKKIPMNKDRVISNLFKKHTKIKKNILLEYKLNKKKLFNYQKIMGLHIRGCAQKIVTGHMLPPNHQDILKFTKNIFEKEKCDKIFIVTEDQNYLDLFKKNFKEKLIFRNTPRSKCNFLGGHNNHFKYYIRKNHRYLWGKETIIDTLLLSSAPIIVFGGESNITAATNILAKKKQKRYALHTEKNSYNMLLARWKWHLKDIFPIFFGRIKSEKIKLNY